MNKKRLSVVMAGAMLATSVAPVLAAEETATTKEYSVGQIELLKKYLSNKVDEKKYTNNTTIKISKYFENDIITEMTNNTSAYVVKKGGNVVSDISKLTVAKGDKIEIFEKENSTFKGQAVAGVAPTVKLSNVKYDGDTEFTSTGFTTLQSELKASPFIKDAEIEKDKVSVKITLEAYNTPGDPTSGNKTLIIKDGDNKLDLNLPLDSEGNLLFASSSYTDEIQNCVGFEKESTWIPGYLKNTDPVKVETINIVADAPTEEEVTYNASELYDGTLITEKGTELLNDLKNAVNVKGGKSVKLGALPSKATNGITAFEMEYYSKGGNLTKKVTVKSSVRKEIETIYNMIKNAKYGVGIVAGQNRYATAVSVAKESGVTALSTSGIKDVVLVNGASLVDGLAAAPLAADKGNAPLLLSKTDSLPTETKEYLTKLVEDVPAKDLSQITISLVGGRTVLSDSLVKELKGMGFSVVRYGGDNREETSLKVAENLKNNTKERAFIVGANGEADAMSISAVAANDKTPIIVSSVHGLTEDAVDYLSNLEGDATIIGGEKAVTKEEEGKIKEARENVKGGTFRIAGANRTETNAKILEKYADTLEGKNLTVVKDGSNDKEELVDALSAANLGGPIVLANSKLSDAQLTKLLKLDTDTDTKLLQVGLGLEDSVIKSLSKTLDITNEKFNFN